jgi:hypothetical protein
VLDTAGNHTSFISYIAWRVIPLVVRLTVRNEDASLFEVELINVFLDVDNGDRSLDLPTAILDRVLVIPSTKG